ncbi:YbaY family lipoprotein [Erwinia sp.]|uniref:YbaY family lipoprotein n=1 Tax=Erwinia citreus TaxID=558 RepID=UPI0028980A94|nr:YbaY family lipoprotein [Erwinia sp.]
MKLWPVLTGAALAVALSGCADKGKDVPTPTLASKVAGEADTLRQPHVSGTITLPANVRLPPDASLTVMLSDASLSDAPAKVISQRVVLTDGKQAPFKFILPFNPADIQPNARILLSAAVIVDHNVVLIADSIKPVINGGGTKDQTLNLKAVPAKALPTAQRAPMAVPSTSPTLVTPTSTVPAPTSL